MEERSIGRVTRARQRIYARCWRHGHCPKCGGKDMTYARNLGGWMCQGCNHVKSDRRD